MPLPAAPPSPTLQRSPRPAPAAGRHTGPPVFVSGCNRGGTTIFTRILSSHPELRDVGRGPFDEGQYVWRTRFRDRTHHRWAVPPWSWTMRRTEAHATPELLEHFRREFGLAMGSPGRLLEKTPANAVRISFINALYPDCRFVHVIRDGRHTTASLVARKVWLPYAPHQWVGAHRTAFGDFGSLPEERVTFVRYEQLLQDPEAVLGEVCRGCGLSWSARERETVMEAARAALRPVDDRWSRFYGWQKRYVLSVIGELQAELGYPVEP